MSNVKKNWDPCCDSVPAGDKFEDHPGLSASMKAIPETPGEKATNDTTALSYNKSQPFGKGGSGYTKGT